jgi:transposase
VELVKQGESPEDVARFLGCGWSSVYTCLKLDRTDPARLAARPGPGPAPRLTADQSNELLGLLREGAEAHGWKTQFWTADRVTDLIERRISVRFHPEHVREILKRRLKWTGQKPKRKAKECDEVAIAD